MGQETQIRLAEADAKGAWAEQLRGPALEALREAQDRLGLELDAPPLVESFAPEPEFYRVIGQKPHHVVAVAIAAENRVVVNRQSYFAADPYERGQTLVHEFTHLLLGRRVPGGVPRWLDEGLAMTASRERDFGGHARLVVAASFGGLTPLGELWDGSKGGAEDLAYAESHSAARFFLAAYGGQGQSEEDNLKLLAQKLADPEEGEALRALLQSRVFMDSFDLRWRASIQNLWTWLAALTCGGLLWIGLTFLFLLAYWRKRRMARAVEERWEREEAYPYDEGAQEFLEDFLEDRDEPWKW